jgi:hypothetical protein
MTAIGIRRRFRVAATLAALAALVACTGEETVTGAVTANHSAADALRYAPTPRLPDGRPDLNGTWRGAGGGVFAFEFVQPEVLPDGSVCLFGCGAQNGAADDSSPDEDERLPPPSTDPFPPAELSFPRYRPEFDAQIEDLRERQVEMDTSLRCIPPGVPRIGPPHKIVQTSNEIVFLYNDYNGGFFRIIPIDGRAHRADLPAAYLGDAVGRFEGDVLVVETVNFTDDTWLTDNGAFHTKSLVVIERLQRVGNTLDYEAVARDPAVLLEPWQARVQTLWLSDRELEEPVPCEDRDLQYMTDGSYHENPR